jgi:hypothetical protein
MVKRATFGKTINSLGTGKAHGPDGIPHEFIKFLPLATRSALFSFLTLLAHKAYTPREWYHSTTCLLHKKETQLCSTIIAPSPSWTTFSKSGPH